MKARVLSLLALLLLVAGCSTSSELFKDDKYIHVGVKVDQPGLAGARPHDPTTYQGFEIQLAWRIAEHFGREPVFYPITSANREIFLQDGRVDLVIASYSITTPRREKVDMVGPYLRSQSGVLVRNDYSGPDQVGAFTGAEVCTADGTTSIELIKKELNGQEPQTAPSFQSCLDKLRDRDVNAVMTDKLILEGFAASSSGEFRVLERVFGQNGYYGIGMRKGHPAEFEEIKKLLKSYVGSAEWKRDFDTYFGGVNQDDHTVDPSNIDEKSIVLVCEAPGQCTER
ncbi:glutamate transport system substrate-binding protein [Saccharopolyspora antimicrobica]|uniref:Amino acid ABC transporter substrate-binding protein (PAAT family) n=1 Tax=Saccharopolyspora antimicrobica TaxID=455193 RepID=A0A1I5HFU7_9PSEU|nr:transporter substrate-binding domain-containing protein [Saccharopolyspora antimicrobica]RKT85335.1 amino acid ABC transporter substrate-binding protein (PAAT family) [Saccharopolyspora antimicrobica]SFO46741.1 glutamate transport system substrate-binding protein [Saccharopolyspora antimicrobica]